MEGSTQRMIFAASCAMRPYSAAVLAQVCQGPSISLPRHQNFTPCGSVKTVCGAKIGECRAAGMIAVFDEFAALRPDRGCRD